MKLNAKQTIHHLLLIAAMAWPLALRAQDPQTEIQYLSGHGPKDAVPWDFHIDSGRRAGEAATIPVPSNWELHGFGTYTYGNGGSQPNEHGFYSRKFTVPESWSARRIYLVFNGVMTDATVKVNGRSAGPTHIGAFYQFKYDITKLLKKDKGAENLLEVEVAKTSSSSEAHQAEHCGDYWVLGGIFRPVWLEAVPDRWIDHVAIDAQADGTLSADLTLGYRGPAKLDGPALLPDRIDAQVIDAKGTAVGEKFTQNILGGGAGRVKISTHIKAPALWTAETPNLYTLRITRKYGDHAVHTVSKRFGFRTFEVRDGHGLFLNGQRILLKGVNRHSFRPESGRALNPEDCDEDVRLIKSMNMNAVRMSHYPPDEAFLDACDERGLYVLDELSGWQHSHNTEIGRRLVREMVEHDVNHPAILFWDNGNEGGWNRDLDGDFSLYDPQQRRVLHPWDPFNGIDTKHYPTFTQLMRCLKGPNLVMPTEFLHGLYDGGGGASLAEYWQAISESPFGAGGFIWVLADEGVRRDDQNGRIDVFGLNAPDGLVGPHHEKEGSYYTVRDIWSPVQIEDPVINEKFNGHLTLSNHYDFTSLEQCRFQWKLLRFPSASDAKAASQTIAEGHATAPAVAAHGRGELALPLPANWRSADALSLVALGPDQQELWNWVWPLPGISHRDETQKNHTAPIVENTTNEMRMSANGLQVTFDATTGILKNVQHGEQTLALSNGPRLAVATPQPDTTAATTAPTTLTSGNGNDPDTGKPVAWIECHSTTGLEHFRWSLAGDGSLRLDYDYTLNGDYLYHGITFDFPENQMSSLRWLGNGPYRVWQNRLRGPWLGIHETAYNDNRPGESWIYPEFKGYFSGLRWASLASPNGHTRIVSAAPDIYLRIGTPQPSHGHTNVAFPTGNLSFMHAIPAIGAKFGAAELYGPTSQPARANGHYHGSLTFSFSGKNP